MPCRTTQDGRTGHGREFWQTMIQWRRKWQTTSVFLSWEPHEQYEQGKDRTLKDELPRLVGVQYATGDQWRNNSRKNEGMEPKQKQHPALNVTGDGSKVQCCKEQYCIGTWNVRSMNQGKLEVVKQEMARVNINILGIRELKWTGTGEFNLDDHYIYYYGQESLKKWNSHHSQQKSPRCSTWLQFQKWQSDLCSFPRHTIQYHGNPNLCPNQLCWRSWSWMVLWRFTRSSRTNTLKRCPFHYRGLECISRKSRNTWSNRQIWPWSTEWSRAKAKRVLPKHTSYSKHLLAATQKTTLHMDIARCSIRKPDWLYSLQPKMEKLYTVSKHNTSSWLWLRSWTPYGQIQT